MANEQIDEALTALGHAGAGALQARRAILERASFDLLQRPALGGQLIARICATPPASTEMDDLLDLLGTTLDTARMARENGKARGAALLENINEALELARRQNLLSTDHRLLIAQLWPRNGLAAPATLELQREEIVSAGHSEPVPAAAQDPGTEDALLDDLFKDLIGQADGEPLALHEALHESFPTMPPELRSHIVAYAAARTEPIFADLACFWLLDADPAIRQAAAAGLTVRLQRGELTARNVSTLTVLRSWMPEDAARHLVDQILKEAMRKGVAAEPEQAAWAVQDILSTLPDGTGAQSLGIALQSGRNRKVAMILLKPGFGIKDAYAIPCRSAKDQTSLLLMMAGETGALPVTLEYVAGILPVALADGLRNGRPPVPGLIEVVRLCGLSETRPDAASTEALISRLASAPAVAALSPQRKGRLINESETWWSAHEILESWFEDNDAVRDHLQQAGSPRAADAALWAWLEKRRDWWAGIITRAAAVLESSNHPDAASFTACAMALIEGRALKKIPIMRDIHEQTIEAWLHDDPDLDEAMPDDFLAVAPLPEQKGELEKTVKGSGLSVDWIDGYLTSVIVAPKALTPDRWLAPIMSAVAPVLTPDSFPRLLDLLMAHTEDAATLASNPNEFAAHMAKRSSRALSAWATGFDAAVKALPAAWPKKSTTADDRQFLQTLANGLKAAQLPDVGRFLASRYARSLD